MVVITTRLVVEQDGSMSLVDPVPAGEYTAQITVNEDVARTVERRPLTRADIPVSDLGPWPAGATFSREEIYDDDGR